MSRFPEDSPLLLCLSEEVHPLVMLTAAGRMHHALRGRLFPCGRLIGAVPRCNAAGTYRQRGVSSLQGLFRAHLPELVARHEAEFAKRLGTFRLERIIKAVERFLDCGDYKKGVARIQCTNPECRAEYFRPFSRKVFNLCPSCSQKRTLI